MFFTRVPLPSLPELVPEDQRRASAYWPLVGAAVGAAVAGVWAVSATLFPPGVAVGLALAAGLLLTGALHEDGFADVCDGFGGGTTRDRVLEIMRDSRIGAFGAIGLVMLLGLKWQAMAALPPALLPAAVIAAHALSRGAAVAMMVVLPYARTDASRARPIVGHPGARLIGVAITALMPLLLLPPPARLAGLVVVAGIWGLCFLWFRHRLGGYTGDCLGALQQLGEIGMLLAVLAQA
ncbi:adenosylcobinamide-GDP ribazoletransferase [Rhodovastum atsumiense]|uniref:Adenosylcobinamide-GDP ribazoletransferase n=2 Tax=Rhodovastum atsumiense TaxID=504468 RepID=A0A5M6ISV5_9PROT|nr:adenosylcobinamide-GDP ribazoletransferase [Rhodovastum atsumiense]